MRPAAALQLAAFGSFAFITACTTIPVDERAEIREQVDRVAEETIAQMVAADPGLQKSLDSAVGYIAARISATKVPIVGGGYGLALLHDKENGSRTYLDVTRFDLGAGLGAGRFRVLIVLESRAAVETFRARTWQRAVGADAAAGSRSGGVMTTFGDGYAGAASSATPTAVAIATSTPPTKRLIVFTRITPPTVDSYQFLIIFADLPTTPFLTCQHYRSFKLFKQKRKNILAPPSRLP